MMPATCVPWPKPSPAVVAPGDVTDVGDDARAARRVLEVDGVAGDAGVDDRDADALPVMPRCQSLSAVIVFG